MFADVPIILTSQDQDRLLTMLDAYGAGGTVADELEEEIARAQIVLPDKVPGDVVTMNSRLTYVDEDTGVEHEVTLVYPHKADVGHNKVSVLSPVGAALLGLREGQSIAWKVPSGDTRRLKVTHVHYQPERAGDFDL